MAVKPTGRIVLLAYWNANSIRNKKLELGQFLSDQCIDIWLINETYLVPEQNV
jgi:hypothetical protein